MTAKWIFLSAALAAALCAQPRVPRPWWDSPLAGDLNLSDAQTRQIRATVAQYRGRLADLRAAVNKAEADLQSLFNEETVDQSRAGEAIEALVSARSELTRTLSQMDLQLRTVLTVDQWQQLQARQQRAGRGGKRRPPKNAGP